MVISKAIARKVSYKLVEKQKQLLEDLERQFAKEVYDVYVSNLPDEVVEMSAKHPQYFTFTNSIRIIGFGFDEWVEVPDDIEVICNQGENSRAEVKFRQPIYKKAKAIKSRIVKEKKDYNKTRYQLEEMLLRLRSYKKIIQAIPQAAEHLPDKSTVEVLTAPKTNYKKLANKVKKLQVYSLK